MRPKTRRIMGRPILQFQSLGCHGGRRWMIRGGGGRRRRQGPQSTAVLGLQSLLGTQINALFHKVMIVQGTGNNPSSRWRDHQVFGTPRTRRQGTCRGIMGRRRWRLPRLQRLEKIDHNDVTHKRGSNAQENDSSGKIHDDEDDEQTTTNT